MTAPSSAGLSPLLDQLDALRADATRGPWGLLSGPVLFGHGIRGRDGQVVAGTGTTEQSSADAALIVAEHNAFPQLTAVIRAVAELADSYPLGTDVPVYRLHRILAALTPGADTAGATA